MKIFTKRDCPLCSNGLTEEAISPDISPDDNIDKIGNYWRGFYKDKLFFHTIDVAVDYYTVKSTLMINI